MTGTRPRRTEATAGVVRLGGWMLVAAVALLPLQGIPGAVSQVFGPAHYHVAPAPIENGLWPVSRDPLVQPAGNDLPDIFAPATSLATAVLAEAGAGAGSPARVPEPPHAHADPGTASHLDAPVDGSADAHVHADAQAHGHPHPHRHDRGHAHGTPQAHPRPDPSVQPLPAPSLAVAHPAHAAPAPMAGVNDTPQGAHPAPSAAPHSHAGIGQHHHRGPADDVVYVVGDGQHDPLALRAGTTGLDHCWSLMPGRCSVTGVRGRAALTAVVDDGHARPGTGAPRRPPRPSARSFLS